jgi:hypothetical protein
MLHPILTSLALAMLWSVMVMSAPAGAQGTPEQRAACQGDAERLCAQYVPDIDRITACMRQNRRNLGPRCRLFFERVGKGRQPGGLQTQ